MPRSELIVVHADAVVARTSVIIQNFLGQAIRYALIHRPTDKGILAALILRTFKPKELC